MDEARREELREKRRLARLRQRRQSESATFRAVAPLLCEARVRFRKLVPERCRAALGRLTSGPGQDERLLWGPIANGRCRPWATGMERDGLLREALELCAEADERVAVIWHPYRAGLALRASDLSAQAARILDAGAGETIWIVAAAGGRWLIEVSYWDRELCWTPAMPEIAP